MTDSRKCSTVDCTKRHFGRGLCSTHYMAWYRKEKPMFRSPKTHGMTQTSEWRAWWNMKQRCNNPKHRAYKNYGGRGIGIYDEWVENFAAFYKFIGKKPKKGLSLDRIDNNGDYEPGNVRWADTLTQNNNRRKPLS